MTSLAEVMGAIVANQDLFDILTDAERATIAADHIRLDARAGQALYEETEQKTLDWMYKTKGIIWMDFPGTVLCRPGGGRFFLYLSRGDDGRWCWYYAWLEGGWCVGFPSAVLAS